MLAPTYQELQVERSEIFATSLTCSTHSSSWEIVGSIVAALRHTPRETGLDMAAIRALSAYWEGVRRLYAPFESDLHWGASEVYMHEMPGGQYTNLRQQSAALGLGARWPEVARAYAEINRIFGDVIKVTPAPDAEWQQNG